MINLKEKLSFSAVNINNNTLSDRKSSRFKPSINIIAVLISAAVFLLLSRSTYAFGIKIAAQESAAGEYISLGDIAEISNFSYSQQKLAELKELQLKRAPQAGYGKNITRVLVDLSVKSLGYSEDEVKGKHHSIFVDQNSFIYNCLG